MTEEITARLSACRVVPLTTTAYRNQSPGYDPTSGSGAQRAGGRYNPANSFPVLYLCTTRPCVRAELDRQAADLGVDVEDLLPRELFRLNLELERTLDLRDPTTLHVLQVAREDITARDRTVTHAIGVAAHGLGVQAILAPSATGVDDVLAVLLDNLGTARCEPHLELAIAELSDFGR